MSTENDNADDHLSSDPEEALRMENELLRLKLMAELGGESHSSGNLPPEIENEFLKNIFAFEQNFSNAKPARVYDLLGKPEFQRSDKLSDEMLDHALEQLTSLMAEKNIAVHFGDAGEYSSRTQYDFITEELFEHQTSFMAMPGMTTHYDYEEFHPNHKKDIESRTIEFLKDWFKQTVTAESWELSGQFVLPDRQILTRAEVVEKMALIFAAYPSFTAEQYMIYDIGFELNTDGGLGHAEGAVKYNAVLENGENVTFNGPFKLYFELEGGWWSIFHLVLPGFEY